MKEQSYKKNYIKIYFWQFLSIILNFISMFIVTPLLTKTPEIYGVYTLCVSTTIFLAYADFGFVGAATKYAAEAYAKGDREKEIKIIGFVTFILIVVISLIAVGFFYLGFNPKVIIKNADLMNIKFIARNLFIILAIFSYTTIIQRGLQIIYGIRLEDYIYQRILMIGNIVKIISTFYFFSNGNYRIVDYFLFMQFINFLCGIISLIIAKKRYSYDLYYLLRNIKFSVEIYNLTKKIAFSSIYVTLLWVLLYDMDSFAISKIWGSEKLAVYALGLTLTSFLRSIYGTIFTPFVARFNHYIGQGNYEGLKKIYKSVLFITVPIVIFPIITALILMKPFILTWVGVSYSEAINISSLLVAIYIYSFISYPTSNLLVALEKTKILNALSTITVVIFWGFIFIFIKLGIEVFAISKLITFTVAALIYLIEASKYLEISIMKFIREIAVKLFIPLITLIIYLMIMRNYLPLEKSKINLIIVMGTGAIGCLVSVGLYFIVNRKIIKNLK